MVLFGGPRGCMPGPMPVAPGPLASPFDKGGRKPAAQHCKSSSFPAEETLSSSIQAPAAQSVQGCAMTLQVAGARSLRSTRSGPTGFQTPSSPSPGCWPGGLKPPADWGPEEVLMAAGG